MRGGLSENLGRPVGLEETSWRPWTGRVSRAAVEMGMGMGRVESKSSSCFLLSCLIVVSVVVIV